MLARWLIMVSARDRRRAAVIGGSLCFAVVLAILVGGTTHPNVVTHHRSPAATTSWVTGDSNGPALRLDQPVAGAAAAVVLLGGLLLLQRRTAVPAPIRFTAHTAAPRGPPGQAR